MKPGIHLRPASQEDDSFLCRLFASTREQLLASLPFDAAGKDAFAHQQHLCQDRFYRQQYPGASYDIVCSADRRIGRLYVNRTRREILIVDIALLPEFRGAGIGGALLRDLLAEAAETGRQVSIHVDKFNPALRLYQRLGFRITQDAGSDWRMEWSPVEPEFGLRPPDLVSATRNHNPSVSEGALLEFESNHPVRDLAGSRSLE